MISKDPHVIGTRIARRRHQLDWSQVELAERLGVSPSTVANWERGAAYPKRKLGKVEQVLGISFDEDTGPPPALSEETKQMMREEVGDEMAAKLLAHYEHLTSGRLPSPGEGGPARGSAARGRRSAG